MTIKRLTPAEFCTIIATGTRRQQLEALRDRVADMISTATAGVDMSSLVLRLTKILDELNSLPADGERSAYDELAAKRVGGGKSAPRRQSTRRRTGHERHSE